MTIQISAKLCIFALLLIVMIPTGGFQINHSFQIALADNLCLGPLACSAIAGSGGDGGTTGDAVAGDIGSGGSCFVKQHSTVGDECGGSTGSSEPRSGSGDHSMNGGRGGEANLNLRD